MKEHTHMHKQNYISTHILTNAIMRCKEVGAGVNFSHVSVVEERQGLDARQD